MISITNLSFDFDQPVFRQANYQFNNGKITFLVARNGKGKTTLFNLIAQDLVPQMGSIKLEGSLMFHQQVPCYFEDMTVQENLETFKTCLNASNDLSEVTHQFQLETISQKVARRLSGGEKQKLYLAITNLGKNDNYLYDEPDSALDAPSRQILHHNLKRKAQSGKTVVVISHHLAENLDLADEICLITDQKLKQVDRQNLSSDFRLKNEEAMITELERRSS